MHDLYKLKHSISNVYSSSIGSSFFDTIQLHPNFLLINFKVYYFAMTLHIFGKTIYFLIILNYNCQKLSKNKLLKHSLQYNINKIAYFLQFR